MVFGELVDFVVLFEVFGNYCELLLLLCGGSVELCECCEVFDDVMIGGLI